MMSHDFFGGDWSQKDQAIMRNENCISQCPACEFEPCPMCTSTTSELDREQSRIAGLYLRYMAISLAGGMVLGAAIVVGLLGYLPLVIGLVSLLFLAIAGLLWIFGDQFLGLAADSSGERDLRVVSVGGRNLPCKCVGAVQG